MRPGATGLGADLRVRARLTAAPWTTAEAAAEELIEIAVPGSSGAATPLSAATRALALATDRAVAGAEGGHSLEQAARLREWCWYGDGVGEGRSGTDVDADRDTPPPRRLHDLLGALADRLLERGGGLTRLRHYEEVGRPYGTGLLEWRYTALELPRELLVAAAWRGTPAAPVTSHVRLAGRHLRPYLEEGVAETHLHVGAGFDAESLWGSACREAGLAEPRSGWGGEPATWPGGPSWRELLLAAALARLLLAGWLRGLARDPRAGVHTWAEERLPARDFGEAGLIRAAVTWARALLLPRSGPRRPRPVMMGAAGTAQARFVCTILARAVHRLGRELAPGRRPAVAGDDPLVATFAPSPSELALLHLSLRQLQRGDPTRDQSFTKLFWQYVRVRVALHRWFVEGPGTPGLDRFTAHLSRVGPLRGGGGRGIIADSLRHARIGARLEAFEARTSASPNLRALCSWLGGELADLAAVPPAPEGPAHAEVGVVFHLVKDRPADALQGRRSWRHEHWYRANLANVVTIERLFEYCPEVVRLVRGADVAGLELSLPTFVFAPLLRRVQRAAERAVGRLPPGGSDAAFGTTIHVGEEFRTLQDGLRRVHELLETGVLRPQERLGHALVLGTDPDRWARRVGRVYQPLDERVDDLLWELDLYGAGLVSPDPARFAVVCDELGRLGRRLFQVSLPLDWLRQARNARHAAGVLEQLRYPTGPVPRSAGASGVLVSPRAVLVHWLSDPGVRHRGAEVVPVDTDDRAVRFLCAAQALLVERLSRIEVTVEANPSSNLIVGDLDCLEDHPALRLQPIRDEVARSAPRVLLSVNSDDPTVFATSLADEFAYLYAALLTGGVPAQDALAWIDRVRRNGLRSRFTIPESRSPELLLQVAGKLSRRAVHAPRSRR